MSFWLQVYGLVEETFVLILSQCTVLATNVWPSVDVKDISILVVTYDQITVVYNHLLNQEAGWKERPGDVTLVGKNVLK